MVETYVSDPNVVRRYEQQIESLRNEVESLRQK